ncbi:Protein unc-93 A [Chamberlinius hualienensis]
MLNEDDFINHNPGNWRRTYSPSEWSIEDLGEAVPLLDDLNLPIRVEPKRLWKNVFILALGVGIFTMGLNPIDDLQSSLNSEQGLGVASLSIKYATMIIGNLLTNTILIRMLGAKKALVFGAMLYGVYIVANFYVTWYTLIPLTLISGFGGALMWTTLGNYLARLAQKYSQVEDKNEHSIKARFFACKGIAGYSFAAVGSLISSIVLQAGVRANAPDPSTSSHYKLCGIDYCNEDLNVHSDIVSNGTTNTTSIIDKAPDQISVYILCGVCLAAVVFAVIILTLFVDALPALHVEEPRDSSKSPLWLFLSTVSLWKNPKQILLIPISIVYGFQEAFWRVEFTKAYITCAMGMQTIGYLMLCYNLASLLSSLVSGFLGRRPLRWIAIVVMISVDVSALITLYFWKPVPDDRIIAFAITGVTGITYGGLSTLLLAFYGIVFSEDLESAYSNLYFWSFLASTLMYAGSFFLCLKIKLSMVLCAAVLGIIGYSIVEYLLERETAKKESLDFNCNQHAIPEKQNYYQF